MACVTFVCEAAPTVGFPLLLLPSEDKRTAGTNAGDWRGYLGGASNNGAWLDVAVKFLKAADLLKNDTVQVLNPGEENPKKRMRYLPQSQQLFEEVLRASLASGTAMQISESPLLEALGIKAVFGKAGDVAVDPSGRTGAVLLYVFRDGFTENPLNSAMLYVVGPQGSGCTVKPKPERGPQYEEAAFLNAVALCGKSALEVVADFNSGCEDKDRIRNIRWCLVSGGIFRHPSCSKVDVAKATVRGMSLAEDSVEASGCDLVVTLLYDEDCFRMALKELTEEA